MNERNINVLLVEDNMADVRLMEEAFNEVKFNGTLHSVFDGEEALNFLYQRRLYKEKKQPDLVILDLNIPKISGHEVLAYIKDDKNKRSIPIVVLTSSQSQQDIIESYNLQANCFIRKPLNIEGFVEVVKSIEKFWMDVACLPDAN